MATGVAVLNRDGGRWEGGYISVGPGGRKTYVLERRFKGRRFHVSTGCRDRRSALGQLDRFEKNPFGYKPEGERTDAGLHITDDDVIRYITWTRKVKGNTREHAREVKRYLSHWLADLGDVDWRSLKLPRLKEILAARKTSRGYRIAALKAFCRWLREEEGALTSAQDVTRDLASVQAVPERMRREKVVSKAVVEQVLARLSPTARALVIVKGGTGIHTSEIRRIIRGENAVLDVLGPEADCLAVARFLHKSRRWDRKRIETQQQLEALRHLVANGFRARAVNAEIRAACVALKVEPFTLSVLRHSWGTWHVAAGVDLEAVAQGYGHQSKKTSDRFYIQVAVPRRLVPPVEFEVAHATAPPTSAGAPPPPVSGSSPS